MDIVKKNWLSITFGLVAILAIVAAFWPLGGYFNELQADLEKGKVRFGKVTGLLGKMRMLPVTEPGQASAKLLGFPTPKTIKDVINSQEGLKGESRNMFAAAVLGNALECLPEGHSFKVPDADKLGSFDPTDKSVQDAMLLTPGSLPNPDSNAPFVFQKALDVELKKLREVVLKGGMPPSQADITAAEIKLRAEKDKDLQFVEKDKPALNQARVDAEYEEARVKIPAQLREQAASKAMLYVEPGVMQIDPSLKTGTLSKEQIWFAQVALWVQTDVARAIRETNALPRPGGLPPATNVTESLVKRLARFDLVLGPDMYQRGGGAATSPDGGGGRVGAGDTAVGGASLPVIPGASDPPTLSPLVSPTQRSTNNLYDVIHFGVVVDIDARASQVFLNQLSRGRLITVRKVDITRPDLTDAATYGYIYSTGAAAVPVIQMNLDCELLLIRDWTYMLMPSGVGAKASIKEMLGIPATYASVLAPPPPQPK